MVFHWSLSDSKSPQVSRTRLSILAVLSNAVVWIVSTRPPNSKSSRPFNNPLVTVPNAPITIGTIVTFMFHSFFQFSSKVEVLIILCTFHSRELIVSVYSNQSLTPWLLLQWMVFEEISQVHRESSELMIKANSFFWTTKKSVNL